MKQRLARVSVHQNSKVLAVLYAVIGLLLSPLMWLASMAGPQPGFPFWAVIAFPVGYALFGYVFTALFAAIYNAVASQVGGFEFTFLPTADSESLD
jgi:apolipoprotein N-acyltransferase